MSLQRQSANLNKMSAGTDKVPPPSSCLIKYTEIVKPMKQPDIFNL